MSYLFTPLTVRGLTFPSRLVMPPMVVVGRSGFEKLAAASDPVTAERGQHYAARAAGGTGLVIVEATAVEPQGRCWAGGLDAWAPEHAPGLARLAAAIRTAGAVPAVQLVHGGPQSSPRIVQDGGAGYSGFGGVSRKAATCSRFQRSSSSTGASFWPTGRTGSSSSYRAAPSTSCLPISQAFLTWCWSRHEAAIRQDRGRAGARQKLRSGLHQNAIAMQGLEQRASPSDGR